MGFERRDGKSIHNPVPDPVQRAEYEKKVWELKREHWTFPEIAEELDISVSTAYKYWKGALKTHMPPAAEDERLLMVQQLENSMRKCMEIMNGTIDDDIKLKAMDRLIRLFKRKAEMLGLDADKKFRVRHEHSTPLDGEIEDLMEEFEESLGKRDTDRAARLANRRKGFRAP